MPDRKAKGKKKQKKEKVTTRPEPENTAVKPPPEPEPPAGSRFLVLFRHGIAEERALDKVDEDRSLTDEGHRKTRRASRGLAELFPEADTLISSPLVRAVQTALWIAKAYDNRMKVHTSRALAPGSEPEDVETMLRAIDGRNVILVGHEPNLTEAGGHFLALEEALPVDLKKAGAIGILAFAGGGGTLEWVLTPRALCRVQ